MTEVSDLPPPTAIALVVCDSIYVDPETKKKALIGLFTNITTPRTPAVHARMCVYAAFTETMPNTKLQLDIVDAHTLDPILEVSSDGPLQQTNPRSIYEFMFSLSNVQFPKEGLYRVRIMGNNVSIIERPIKVDLIGGPSKEYDHDHDNE